MESVVLIGFPARKKKTYPLCSRYQMHQAYSNTHNQNENTCITAHQQDWFMMIPAMDVTGGKCGAWRIHSTFWNVEGQKERAAGGPETGPLPCFVHVQVQGQVSGETTGSLHSLATRLRTVDLNDFPDHRNRAANRQLGKSEDSGMESSPVVAFGT
ncbi:hypothetical protein BJX70DRAFT_361036 [Aspergillus crustosus]